MSHVKFFHPPIYRASAGAFIARGFIRRNDPGAAHGRFAWTSPLVGGDVARIDRCAGYAADSTIDTPVAV
ncbi:hypothetical protein DPV74_01875 [Burkholderia sp. HAN2018]|nr:hypothetical protein [Burkholderia sp. HAN2018]